MAFPSISKVTGSPAPALPSPVASHPVPKPIGTQYLLAGVAALLTLELLLSPVRLLVLEEAVALVEDGGTVAALHLRGFVRVQVAHVDP